MTKNVRCQNRRYIYSPLPVEPSTKRTEFSFVAQKKCKDISMFINKNFFKQYRYVFIYKRTYTLRFCL